jgi:hypothetical protein
MKLKLYIIFITLVLTGNKKSSNETIIDEGGLTEILVHFSRGNL